MCTATCTVQRTSQLFRVKLLTCHDNPHTVPLHTNKLSYPICTDIHIIVCVMLTSSMTRAGTTPTNATIARRMPLNGSTMQILAPCVLHWVNTSRGQIWGILDRWVSLQEGKKQPDGYHRNTKPNGWASLRFLGHRRIYSSNSYSLCDNLALPEVTQNECSFSLHFLSSSS
jgi:hypothetical protein